MRAEFGTDGKMAFRDPSLQAPIGVIPFAGAGDVNGLGLRVSLSGVRKLGNSTDAAKSLSLLPIGL